MQSELEKERMEWLHPSAVQEDIRIPGMKGVLISSSLCRYVSKVTVLWLKKFCIFEPDNTTKPLELYKHCYPHFIEGKNLLRLRKKNFKKYKNRHASKGLTPKTGVKECKEG